MVIPDEFSVLLCLFFRK